MLLINSQEGQFRILVRLSAFLSDSFTVFNQLFQTNFVIWEPTVTQVKIAVFQISYSDLILRLYRTSALEKRSSRGSWTTHTEVQQRRKITEHIRDDNLQHQIFVPQITIREVIVHSRSEYERFMTSAFIQVYHTRTWISIVFQFVVTLISECQSSS